MIQNIYKYITIALLFVSFATIAQTPTTITKDGNYTVTGSETLTATESIILKPNSWIKPGSTFYARVSADAYISPTLSTNENYVFTRAFQAPITETELNDPSIGIKNNKDVIESITYFDGLGRAKQQVGIKASPDKKDIVTHITYDDYGRQDKQYLSFERENDTNHPIGSYTTVSINTDINSYYKSKYSDDFTDIAATHQDFNAYSESIFEPSPLNRVLEQGAPGKDWKANKDVDTDHTIKFDWGTNAAQEVIYFKVDFPLVNGQPNTEVPTLEKDGYYGANQLYVTITKDENWKTTDGDNHTTKEYKDKLGKVILKRTYNSSSPSTGGSPEGDGGQHDTYYVYDDFGNLSYVIPPKVTLSATDGVSPEELNELCYQYKYDYRNRLVEKKISGKGDANTFESIVYNTLDQPILTQDPNQKVNNEWLFTKYDAFGRVAYTGKITIANKTRTQIQDEVNDFAGDLWVNRGDAVLIGGTTMYYNNGGYPDAQNAEVLTINYYDDYEIGNQVSFNPANGAGTWEEMTPVANVKGLSTVSRVKVLDTGYWITNAIYYDNKGRPWETHVKNDYLGTEDWVLNKLDFAGKILKTNSTHTKDGVTITTVDTFTYDHMGRLLGQKQTINNQTPETIVANTYDALGQLETKETGGGLQEVDYTYNVRGWLKNINNDSKNDNDLFNFRIRYNDITDVTKKLYNGNISQTQWSTENDNPTTNPVSTEYTYAYDALNRITSAIDNTGNYNLTNIGYDKNGNILNLQRQGHMNSGATSFGLMDNLGYQYDNESNKLTAVTDISASIEGFKDGTNPDDDYNYDDNGNMISDRNKGITEITYNHLNLPIKIHIERNDVGGGTGFTPTTSISYVYDAVGGKLSKSVQATLGSPAMTQYSGNYIYKKSASTVGCGGCPEPELKLEFMNHPEGYIEPVDENDLSKGFDYIYQYKDHLGNIRLSYADKDNDGTIDILRNDVDIDGDNDNHMEILEEKNYYPFGLEHKGYNNTITGREHPYKYQGVEFNENLGLNLYEMDFRQYDPAIARFNGIDPVTHYEFSTYNAFDNNPVFWSDPSGADGEHYNWSTGKYENDKGEEVSYETALASQGLNADGSQQSSSPDDTYKVGKNGKIRKVDDKKHFDKNGNEVDKLISDKTGKSKLVDKGILNLTDTDTGIQNTTYQYFYTPNGSKSRILFNWLAANTDVEFSLLTYSNHAYIATSFSKSSEAGGVSLLYETLNEGIFNDSNFTFTHNHPSGSLPSGFNLLDGLAGKENDKQIANFVARTYPSVNIKWFVRASGRTNLIQYNGKKIIKK